jgi:hypothetical protein
MAYRGDGLRLRQVLINLLGNAVKFTEQGHVLLRVLAGEPGSDGRACLRFEVEDTGIGIRADKQAAVFESFAQEDGSTTRRFGGTGLGLAICKQLVALMGGEIGVRSTAGAGSTFWFSVALHCDPATDAPPSPGNLAGRTVLVVDHHHLSRAVLRELLQGWELAGGRQRCRRAGTARGSALRPRPHRRRAAGGERRRPAKAAARRCRAAGPASRADDCFVQGCGAD